MKALIQSFLWMCMCAPPTVRVATQDRVIQFLLVGEMASLADGSYIADAQEQVLYIVAQGAKEDFPPLKTEKLWAHPLVSMATAANASKNAISIVAGLIKRLQPRVERLCFVDVYLIFEQTKRILRIEFLCLCSFGRRCCLVAPTCLKSFTKLSGPLTAR